MQRREGKAAAALSALDTRPRRQLTPAEAQAFYDRLLEDSEHRIRNRCTSEHHTSLCLERLLTHEASETRHHISERRLDCTLHRV